VNRVARTVTSAFIVLLLVSTCIAEHRFQSGPYSGFTKLEQERVIVELPKPLHIREVSGTVLAAKSHEPIGKTLFELRDDRTGKVKATKTDGHGRFRLKHIKDGKYTFKATRKGYQSVVGVLILREKAPESQSLSIEMPKVL
jgi:Carboxypeptidase regulatory-like domain